MIIPYPKDIVLVTESYCEINSFNFHTKIKEPLREYFSKNYSLKDICHDYMGIRLIEFTLYSEEYEFIKFSVVEPNTIPAVLKSEIKAKEYSENDLRFLLDFHEKAIKMLLNPD